MKTCAADTEFPLEDKDYSHESFPYFANCVKNNMFMNLTLNQNSTVKSLLGDVHY